MNFAPYIDHNRSALLRLVGLWFASVALGSGQTVTVVKRHVYWRVTRLVRAAEAALRRLIFAEAQGLVVAPRAKRAAPTGKIPRGDGTADHVSPFPLFDPLWHLGPPPLRRKPVKRPGPRIWFFDGTDPPFEPYVEPPEPLPDDPVDAGRLLGRIESLKRALEDVSKQAKRLARIRARREQAGRLFVRPMRPGRPPGHRDRGRGEIDEILRECQWLALRAGAGAEP